MKETLQRAARLLVGEYQIFHIVTSTRECALASPPNASEKKIQCTPVSEGFRFSVAVPGEQLAEACSCSFWTAETSNRVRNFISLASNEAELVLLETHAAHRKRGWAKKLVRAASADMLERGFTRLYASIWHSNKVNRPGFPGGSWV